MISQFRSASSTGGRRSSNRLTPQSNRPLTNAEPKRIVLDGSPAYQRQYVLPLTMAIQSAESWRWPPPEKPDVRLLDKLLNSTSLTTQVATHKDIIQLGSEAGVELANDLRGRIAEVERLQRNLTHVIAEEVKKIKAEMEYRYKQELQRILSAKQNELVTKADERVTFMQAFEDERIQRIEAEFRLKTDQELANQAAKFEERLKAEIERAIAQNQIKNDNSLLERISAAMEKQKRQLEGEFQAQLEEARAAERRSAEELAERRRLDQRQKHELEMDSLKQRWLLMCERYDQLLNFAQNVERDYAVLEAEFCRFVENVKGAGGHFSADFLIRSRRHGLIVTKKLGEVTDIEACDATSVLRKMAAVLDEPASWPDGKVPPITSPRDRKVELATVKLLRPLDADEIGEVKVPLRQPEGRGASFVLSFGEM